MSTTTLQYPEHFARTKLALERSLFASAAVHGLLFLLCAGLLITRPGPSTTAASGLILFGSFGMLALRRAQGMRRARLRGASRA